LSLESRFTFGGILVPQKIPLPERFFGGIGLSTIEATGEVYNLRDLGQFLGTYGQARYGLEASP